MIWQWIDQVERHENRVVLLGKRDVSEIILALRRVNKRYEKAVILME
jgi:hypothetical protein